MHSCYETLPSMDTANLCNEIAYQRWRNKQVRRFSSKSNLTENLQRIKDTGYDDDIKLLMVATDSELNQIFYIVGMSSKPGHVLIF